MFNAFKSQRVSLQILLPFIGFLPFFGLVIWPASGIPETHNVQGWLYSTYRELLTYSPRLLLYGSFVLTTLFSSYMFWVNTNRHHGLTHSIIRLRKTGLYPVLSC